MATSPAMTVRKRVVVIGGGFGGIHAALGLGKMAVDVTLVDRKNHHTFQPLLYQVALAVLSPADIAQPIRSILREHKNIDVLMDEAVGFDLEQQRVQLRSGSQLEYDYLIVATGSTHSYFGKIEWARLAPGLKTVEDALEIRRRVLLAFELAERQMLETGKHPALNFVIIGGGPTGVELAGAISDIARLYMRKDFRHITPSSASVLILEGSPNILTAYPEDLRAAAVRQLHDLGVKVQTGMHVTDIQPGYVMIGDERIDSICTLWAAGVQASPLGKLLGVEVDKKGSVLVDEHLNPKGHPEIYICGDLAHFEQDGKQVPGVAQPAMQMGDYAAQRIARLVGQDRGSDGPLKDKGFRYFDKGDMATIGRKAAVAKIEWPFHAHWSGFPAWVTWLVVHIFFLIGFRNRFSVLPPVGLHLFDLLGRGSPDHRFAGVAGLGDAGRGLRDAGRDDDQTARHALSKKQLSKGAGKNSPSRNCRESEICCLCNLLPQGKRLLHKDADQRATVGRASRRTLLDQSGGSFVGLDWE